MYSEAQARHASRIITIQPKPQTFKLNVLSLPIVNAHEFAPHPKLSGLSAFDTLIVTEELDLLEAATGLEGCNKYKIMTKSGSLLFEVNEGKERRRGACQVKAAGVDGLIEMKAVNC